MWPVLCIILKKCILRIQAFYINDLIRLIKCEALALRQKYVSQGFKLRSQKTLKNFLFKSALRGQDHTVDDFSCFLLLKPWKDYFFLQIQIFC